MQALYPKKLFELHIHETNFFWCANLKEKDFLQASGFATNWKRAIRSYR